MNCPARIIQSMKINFPLWLALAFNCFISTGGLFAQAPGRDLLEKMPVELERAFALSALPPHLRTGAAVYLLDPAKGYYLDRTGSNGFICFVARTEWEYAVFSPDIATAIAYDAEGTRTVFQLYKDVAAMRASGKFTAVQVRDSILGRISRGFYQVPEAGISYMLSPVMRNYPGDVGDNAVMTMSGPHYMFYAPYLTNAGIGNTAAAAPRGPVVVNQGDKLLGIGKGPFGYIILPAGLLEKAAIIKDNRELLDRLIAYKAYFRIDTTVMHH